MKCTFYGYFPTRNGAIAQPAQEWECSSNKNGVIHVNIKLNVSTWIDLELFAIGFDLMGEKKSRGTTLKCLFPPFFFLVQREYMASGQLHNIL